MSNYPKTKERIIQNLWKDEKDKKIYEKTRERENEDSFKAAGLAGFHYPEQIY